MNYNQWAHFYDQVFPYRQETYHFLNTRLNQGRVLDLACGTATYALKLSEAGYDVEACDLSEPLIKLAKEKALAMNLNIGISVCDMRAFQSKPDMYDGAYIIGNSLVHLKDEVEILNVLKALKKALKPNASCVIQVVNYNRVLEQKIDALPPIETSSLTMERQYRFKGGKVLFDTTLHIDGERHKHTVSLLPLRQNVLLTLLELAGFKNIDFYGDFSAKPYDPRSSFHTIAVAKA